MESRKEFWDTQAKTHVNSSLATSPDTIAYKMEIQQLLDHIPAKSSVIDFGCGNGIKGIELALEKSIQYTGIDFSDEMIRQALQLQDKSTTLGYTSFHIGDILDTDLQFVTPFDIAITDRCLINLPTFEDQIAAVRNIHQLLKDDGIYLMVENHKTALDNLNAVRRIFELPAIEVRWHNLYITDMLFDAICKQFMLVETVNFASTYFLISRTLNAVLHDADYNSELNQLAAKLPALGNFSPVKLFVLRKI